MLVSFSVSNFLSFNQKTTFTMESGRATKKTEHLILDDVNKKSLLRFSAIFGKNGAGKSNFVRAVYVLKNFVVIGKLPQRSPIMWCRIDDKNENKATEFEIQFITNNQLYEYKISIFLATGIIQNEELVKIVGNRHTKLFYKETSKNEYIFHHSLKGQKTSSSDIEVLSRTFGQNGCPFLFSINHNTQGFFNSNAQAKPLKDVFLWFKDTLEVIFPDQPLQETSLLRYDLCIDDFEELLKEFDTGIEKIRLEPVSKEKVFEILDLKTQQKLNLEMALVSPIVQLTNLTNQLNSEITKLPSKNQTQIPIQKNLYSSVIRSRRNIFIISLEKDNEFHFYALKFVHNIGGKKVEFTMESESDGTHRLFQLIEILVYPKEKVFVMDEINRSLHPSLTVEFVKKYFSKTQGKKIQLITTTHETHIMSHALVRRDEIWIADTNDDKSTKFFSLENEQVRIDKVLEENYLTGTWGGVPKFDD